MEHQKPSIKPIAYNYGIYLALITIAGIIILYVLNQQQNWIASLTSFLITVVVYFYGIKEYKKRNSNFLSVKDALKVGMGMAVISGVIAAIYAVIHYGIIAPEFIDGIREKAYNDMVTNSPGMTSEQLEAATGMMNLFTSKFFMATMFLISSLFIGFIISLIMGAIMKNDYN